MILAKEFNRNSIARDCDLTLATTAPQPPTILQLGANSPVEFARAASLAAPYVGGVDLNCGCPQSWACAETLGAALMDRRELVRDMVLAARTRLAADAWLPGPDAIASPRGRSISVKIRVHKDLRRTVDFITTVLGDPNRRNIDFLTIHPRTKNTPSTAPINADALGLLTDMFGDAVPILLSGDVFSLDSLPAHPDAPPPLLSTAPRDATATDPAAFPAPTKLAGVMSARALLANPALFAGARHCPWEAVEVFMNRVARAPLPLKLTLRHLNDMCGPGAGRDKHALLDKKERATLQAAATFCDAVDFLDDRIAAKVPGREAGMRRDV